MIITEIIDSMHPCIFTYFYVLVYVRRRSFDIIINLYYFVVMSLKLVIIMITLALGPFVMCTDPYGEGACGGMLGWPTSCWRYCNGNSESWCWTDQGHSCSESSVGNSMGNCKGRKCYASKSIFAGLVDDCWVFYSEWAKC